LDGSQKAVSASFGENDHGIDAGQGGEDLGALLLRDERSTGALELANRFVAIEPDDEDMPEVPGTLEIADVAEVQQIETPVRGDNLPAATARRGGPTSHLGQS
jgi:hypothetical protein